MAAALTLFPWQLPAWRQFQSFQSALSPLLLLQAQGLGEAQFVRYLAMTWQCLRTDKPCQHCAACQQVLAESHASTIFTCPEDEEKTISVDWVRQAVARLQQKAERKFLGLLAAERLTLAAANALLKFLEEPPTGMAIIVSSSHPSALLPTLRSRLRPWVFPRPAFAAVWPWLQAQHPDASALALRWGWWLSGGALLTTPPLPEQANDFFKFIEYCLKASQENWPLRQWQLTLQTFSEEALVNFAWRFLFLSVLARTFAQAPKPPEALAILFLETNAFFPEWQPLWAFMAKQPINKILAFQDLLLYLAALRQQNVQKDLWWVHVALPFFELFSKETL